MVVPLSKVRISLILLGSVGFVALGCWLWPHADSDPHHSPLYVKAVAAAAIAFFSVCGLFALFKLFDRSPGLVIDAQGIIDNSSGLSAGRIPWSDIRGLHVTVVQRRKFLCVQVDDPDKYVQRASFLKRQLVRMNAKYFGGPILISTVALSTDFDELLRVATESLERHRRA